MTTPPQNTKPTAAETPNIDFEEFAHFFEGEDITEEQAREFLQTYWVLALEIMAISYGFHPVQQAKSTCGKLLEDTENNTLSSDNAVKSEQETINTTFNVSADL